LAQRETNMPEQSAPSDTTAPVAAPAPATPAPEIKAELDRQMAISLNGGAPPQTPQSTAGKGQDNETPPAPPADPFGIVKEKFGYESPEAAVLDIERLRAFHAAPPVQPLKFENPVSQQVVEALQAGKLNEVHEILDQQLKIDRLTAGEMTADSAADVVKLGMQIKYKDLTPAEINFRFNKQYGLPPKPALLPAEDQDEYNERVAAWQAIVDDKKMELLIDAKLARPELAASKSKLVFPTIDRPQEAAFQEWQKSIAEDDRLSAETTEAYKAFTPKSLESKQHFTDKDNKVDFDFTYEPDPEGFNQAMTLVSDIEEFWKSYYNPDGTPDRKRFLADVYFMKNRDKVIAAALRQSMNATIKAGLPDNSTGGLVRQLPQTQEPNELDKMMRASLKGYGGF
jgi:hypothetical protein